MIEYDLCYFVIWSTRYGTEIKSAEMPSLLIKSLGALLDGMPGVTIDSYGLHETYMVMAITIPPKYSIHSVMTSLQNGTSEALKDKLRWPPHMLRTDESMWSSGYFISTDHPPNDDNISDYLRLKKELDNDSLRIDYVESKRGSYT